MSLAPPVNSVSVTSGKAQSAFLMKRPPPRRKPGQSAAKGDEVLY